MKLINQVWNEDCIYGMIKIPDNYVDLIITDPPYGIKFNGKQKANYNRDDKFVLDGYNEIPLDEYPGFTHLWMSQAERVLKTTGSMYVFSGFNNLHIIQKAIYDLGFDILNHIPWKYQFGLVTKRKFVTSHWTGIFAVKNSKAHNFYPNCRFSDDEKFPDGRSKRYADMEDVWIIPKEYWHGKTRTPTKLPGALVEKILQYSSKKGDIVFDPFMGSGQVQVMSKRLKRKYMGFEKSPGLFEFAKGRIEDEG